MCWCPTGSECELSRLLGQSKISDFGIVTAIGVVPNGKSEHVVQLQVPVHDLLLVDELHGLRDLLRVLDDSGDRDLLLGFAVLLDLLSEGSELGIFHHEVQLPVVHERAKEFNYVRMAQLLVVSFFPHESEPVHSVSSWHFENKMRLTATLMAALCLSFGNLQNAFGWT